MSDPKSYYATLGLTPDATDKAIADSYRKLAMKYHPDRKPENPEEAEAKFKLISEAFSVLGDKDKRKHYDAYGAAPNINANNFGGFNMDDIFDMMGGFNGFGGKPQAKRNRGNDILVDVNMTLEEVYTGLKDYELSYHPQVTCEKCAGTGAEVTTTCPVCKGKGQQITQSGPMRFAVTCRTCAGSGKKIEKYCDACNSHGFVNGAEEKIKINVPKGVESGMRIRFPNKGSYQGTNPRGDLYVGIVVTPHNLFIRNDCDLHCDLFVPYSVLALGGKITLKTLSELVEFTVPPNTFAGNKFSLRGKGITSAYDGRLGDLIVCIRLDVPASPTEEYINLMQKLTELEKSQSFTKVDSCLDKINTNLGDEKLDTYYVINDKGVSHEE